MRVAVLSAAEGWLDDGKRSPSAGPPMPGSDVAAASHAAAGTTGINGAASATAVFLDGGAPSAGGCGDTAAVSATPGGVSMTVVAAGAPVAQAVLVAAGGAGVGGSGSDGGVWPDGVRVFPPVGPLAATKSAVGLPHGSSGVGRGGDWAGMAEPAVGVAIASAAGGMPVAAGPLSAGGVEGDGSRSMGGGGVVLSDGDCPPPATLPTVTAAAATAPHTGGMATRGAVMRAGRRSWLGGSGGHHSERRLGGDRRPRCVGRWPRRGGRGRAAT